MASHYQSAGKPLHLKEPRLNLALPKIERRDVKVNKNPLTDAISKKPPRKVHKKQREEPKPEIKMTMQQSKIQRGRQLNEKVKHRHSNAKSSSLQGQERSSRPEKGLYQLFDRISQKVPCTQIVHRSACSSPQILKRHQKCFKRSPFLAKKYKISQSDILDSKISHSRSNSSSLEHLENQLYNLIDLEEQSSNCLRKYVENRKILEGLLKLQGKKIPSPDR